MVQGWKSGWDYGSGMKIRLGLWFMNENQLCKLLIFTFSTNSSLADFNIWSIKIKDEKD